MKRLGFAAGIIACLLLFAPPAKEQIIQGGGGSSITSQNFDTLFGTTQGSIIERGAGGWRGVAPGTTALPWVSNGPGNDPAYQALTSAGIAAATITSGNIASGTITSGNIASATITGGNIASATVANSNLANMNAGTIKGNNTGSPAAPIDLSGLQAELVMNFIQGGTGANQRSLDSEVKLNWIHSLDYAVGNGITDDTTALQNWINQCAATVKLCYLDAATYKISAFLSISSSIKIIGSGTNSIISMSNTTQDGIHISTTSPVWLSDFEITTSVTPTAGIGINVTAASMENSNSHFSGLYFVGIWQGIDFVAASHWEVSFCHFELLLAQALIVQNTNNADSGDSIIMGNDIIYTATTSNMIGIYQASSGGLKIIGNKINSPQIAYDLNPPGTGTSSGITIISGNSFENCAGDCILLDPQSATPANLTWAFVQITGNELMCAVANCTLIAVNAISNPFWINGVVIVGNALVLNNSAGVALGFQANFAAGVVIGNNYFINVASVAGDVGISILANASNTRITDNTQVNFAAGNWIQSASATTVIKDTNQIAFANAPASVAPGSQILFTSVTAGAACAAGASQSTGFFQNAAWKCF